MRGRLTDGRSAVLGTVLVGWLCLSGCVRVDPGLPPVAPGALAPAKTGSSSIAVSPTGVSTTAVTRTVSPPPVSPSSRVSSVLAEPSAAVRLAVQTRLDRANFSPGGLDGRWGSKSGKALAAWRKSGGVAGGATLDAAATEALGDTNGIWTVYTVTEADHAALTPYPSTWLGKSKQERLGYTCVEELVAEKFHVYRGALRQWNPEAHWPNPPAGTALRVPGVMHAALPSLARLEIRLGEKTLRAYAKDGRLVAQFPCSIAADKAKRPAGETLHVKVWAADPEYTFDPEMYADQPEAVAIGKRLRIPPGPNNPVGVAWIGLDRPGYGIHGTPHPEDISKSESHGCFRLTNWDAQKLVRAVRMDLPVVVLP